MEETITVNDYEDLIRKLYDAAIKYRHCWDSFANADPISSKGVIQIRVTDNGQEKTICFEHKIPTVQAHLVELLERDGFLHGIFIKHETLIYHVENAIRREQQERELAKQELEDKELKERKENRRFWISKFIAPTVSGIVAGIIVGLTVFFITNYFVSKGVLNRLDKLESRVNQLATPPTPAVNPTTGPATRP